MNNQKPLPNSPQQQTTLYDIQQQVAAIQAIQPPNSLEYKALNAAYQAIRLAFFATDGRPAACRDHLRDLDGTVQHLAEALFPQQSPSISIPQDVPTFLPDWLAEAA